MDREQFVTAALARRNFEYEDLSGADLSDLHDTGINLSYANCTGTNFQNSNFSDPEWNRGPKSTFYFAELDVSRSCFFQTNFQGANLAGARFEALPMQYANFQRANLQATSFFLAKLQAADFRGAHFIESSGADASVKTNFQRADLCKSNFENCLLRGADFSNAALGDAHLHGAHLARASFSNAHLQGTNLTHANLEQASFSAADLSGAKLNGANLTQANFKGANLYLADFSDAEWQYQFPPKIDKETRLIPKEWEQLNYRVPEDRALAVQGCFQNFPLRQLDDLTGNLGVRQRYSLWRVLNRKIESVVQLANAADVIDFGGGARLNTNLLHRMADQRFVPMITGNHAHQNMSAQNLGGTFFDRATMPGVDLAGQNLAQAVVHDSDWRGINLRGADLQGAVLCNVDLAGADLRDADLSGAILVNCNLDGVKLDGVIIDKTRMVQSTLKNIHLGKAIIHDFLIERSMLDNITFAGGAGDGVIINGFGLYDSAMTNSRFEGNCQIAGIELEGSLMIADGGGMLTHENVYVSPMSEWQQQRIHLLPDHLLGDVRMERIVEAGRIETPEQSLVVQMLNRLRGHTSSQMNGLIIYDLVQDDKGPLGKVPVLEHLAHHEIGYQPMPALKQGWQPSSEKKLILPVPG